jgi:hypothetical protein
MFHCAAYGLALSTALEIPEWDLAAAPPAPPDVTIEMGPVPEALEQPHFRGVCFQAAPGAFLLQVPGIARYLVRDGRQVTIDRAAAAEDATVRVFLLGTVLGALLQQRGRLVLHGSAIATARGAILLVGPSASGKSTLAAEFWRRGYRVLADELCALDVDSGGARLWTASGHLKLWADVLEKLGIATQGLARVRPELEKYDLPVNASSTRPVPVVAACSLAPSNTSELALTTLAGFDRFREWTDATFRLRFLKGMQLLGQHFQQIRALQQHVPIARVVRPRSPMLLRELADLVEKNYA